MFWNGNMIEVITLVCASSSK